MKVEPIQIAAALPATAQGIAHRIAITAAQQGLIQRLERSVAVHHRRRCGIREVTEAEVLARTGAAVDVVVERLRTKRKPASEARMAEVVSAYRNGLLVVQSKRTLEEIGRNMGKGVSATIRGELDEDCEHVYADALQHLDREIAHSQRGLGILIGCGVAALGLAGLGATLPWN